MPSTVEVLGPCERKVSLTIDRSTIQRAIDQQYRELAKHANIKGFRKGKVPRRILDKHYGDKAIAEMRQKVIWTEVGRAIEEHKLQALDLGEIDVDALDWSGDGEMSIDINVDIRPQIELKKDDYRGLDVASSSVEVSDEDVDAEVEQLRKRLTVIEDAGDVPVGPLDFLLVNIEYQFLDGTSLPVREGRVVDLTQETLDEIPVDDLKGQFLGKRQGDSVLISVKIPDGFDVEERRGQTSKAKAEIKSVRRMMVPEVDDDFIKKVGCESHEDLKQKLRSRLRHHRERERSTQIEEELLDRLLEKFNVDVPDTLLDRTFHSHTHRLRHQMEDAGLEEIEIQKKMLEFEKPGRDGSRKSLQVRFLLDQIAELENIKVSEEDLSAYVSAIAQAHGRDPSELVDEISENRQWPDIAGEIARQKARKALREHSHSTDLSNEGDTSSTDEESSAPTA